MGAFTKDPNVLMRKWMEVYMNLNMMRSTDSGVQTTLDEMKDRLAECNEYVMRFFDKIGAEPEGLD